MSAEERRCRFSSSVSLFLRDCHRLVLILGNYVLKILLGYLAFEFLTYTFCNYYFKLVLLLLLAITHERPLCVQNIGYISIIYVKYFKFV